MVFGDAVELYFPGAGLLVTDRSFTAVIRDKAPPLMPVRVAGKWLKSHSRVKTHILPNCINGGPNK